MEKDFNFYINILPQEIVSKLKKTYQNPIFHSEGSVYNHTEMVFNELRDTNNIDLLISAIFHDLGKIDTVRAFEKEVGIKVQTIGHENYAEKYIDSYGTLFNKLGNIDWDKVKFICKEHMRAHKYLAGEIKKENKRALFENHPYSKDLLIFAKADNKGRIKDMKNQSELIILMGIPGSGKSTWRRNFTNKFPQYKVICPDDLRKEITGNVSDISQDAKVWETAYHNLKELLTNKEDVIFDSTACNTRTQKALENIGRNHNAIILYKIFEIDASTAKERISKDIDSGVDRSKVPMEIVDKMAEGFIKAKERILEEAKNLNVLIITEKFKDTATL